MPDNAYGRHLLKFFPEGKPPGGWIGFQSYEDAPIEFEYMYKAKPVWVKPQPRVRLQTEADTLRASLHDTILKQVLREKGSDTGGSKADRVQRLLGLQDRAAIEAALTRSAEHSKKKKSSGAAAAEASALISVTERLAAISGDLPTCQPRSRPCQKTTSRRQ